MEHLLESTAFWVFMIVAVVKWSDVKRAKAYASRPAELEALSRRITDLETQVSSQSAQMLELKDGHDFTMKLLDDKKQTVAR